MLTGPGSQAECFIPYRRYVPPGQSLGFPSSGPPPHTGGGLALMAHCPLCWHPVRRAVFTSNCLYTPISLKHHRSESTSMARTAFRISLLYAAYKPINNINMTRLIHRIHANIRLSMIYLVQWVNLCKSPIFLKCVYSTPAGFGYIVLIAFKAHDGNALLTPLPKCPHFHRMKDLYAWYLTIYIN